MTDFTRDWIAKREQLEQAATEGPWEADGGGEIGQHCSRPEPWEKIVSTDVACMAYCYGGSAAGVEREGDAEFIADARTSLPAAVAALKAVLTLHRQAGGVAIPVFCLHCQEFNDGTWPCPTVRAVEAALKAVLERLQPPCPTVRAVEAALRGES